MDYGLGVACHYGRLYASLIYKKSNRQSIPAILLKAKCMYRHTSVSSVVNRSIAGQPTSTTSSSWIAEAITSQLDTSQPLRILGQAQNNSPNMPGPDKRSLPNGSDGDGVFAYKPSEEESFFIPSYLQNSRYMEKLQNLHNHSQQKRHAQSRASNPASRSASSTNLKASGLSKGANQSIVNDIAERTSPVHLDDTLRPLPSRWVENTKTSSLLISHDGRELLLRDDIKSADDAAAVKANNYIPQECGIYYYEVTLMSKGMVGLGLSGTRPSVTRLPGWEQDSWGYHGDDGFTYGCTATAGKAYGPKFSENDVVGCGVDFRSRTIFYTKNGVFLGDAHHDVPCNRLYPSIGMKKRNDCIRTNFGQAPFVFDIDSMVEVRPLTTPIVPMLTLIAE